jgi:acyl-CoA thioesterase FadM
MTSAPAEASDPGGIYLEVEAATGDAEFHVHNLGVEEIFFTARNEFLLGLGIDDLWHQPVVPQLRELLTLFESEIAQGTSLQCQTTVVSRSRRAFVMEQTLRVSESGGVAATCKSVHVTVDESGAVDIPEALWAAIEDQAGRTIPWVARG